MQGTPLFNPVAGKHWELGYLNTTGLALSDGNADLGTIKTGKAITFAANSQSLMRYAGSFGFMGFLGQDINLNGMADLTTYLFGVKGWLNNPIRRGLACTLLVPEVNSLWEIEGLGAVGINTLLVTSGSGAIASGTTINTELTLQTGAWRQAALAEPVYGLLLDGSLTPNISGNVRALIKMVSPYIKSETADAD